MAINVNQLKNSSNPRLSQLNVNSKTYELWDDTARLAIKELQDNFDGLVGDLDNLNSYADTGFQSMMDKVGHIYKELTKLGDDNGGLADSVLDTLFNKFNGDSAKTALALTSNAGSSTRPVYFSGGKPVQVTFTNSKGGPTANATLTHGGTFKVPYVEQAVGGQVTVTERTMTMPAATTWTTISGKPSTFTPTIGTTATTAAAGNHTHTTSLATDSGTSSITLASAGKYKLTAGGTSVIFTMPTLLTIGTTATTAAAGNHTHTTTLATDTGTSSITLASAGKYKLTAGGKSVIFTMPTIPTVNNATLTISGQSGSKTFTANASSNVSATVSLYEKTAPSASNNYTLEIGVKLS